MRNLNTARLFLVLLCLALPLGACDEPVPVMPAQTWNGIRVEIETRPPQLGVGMNEFLIMATREKHHEVPAHDLIVSLAINDDGHWEQAIQDGFVGVYRRALRVSDPAQDVLLVRLERGKDTGLLRFPLKDQRLPSQ